MYNKPTYIEELDGVRGIAVLMVLLGHMPEFDIPYIGVLISNICGFFHLPFIGVDIFFCLSGFLITRIILYKKSNGIFSFKNFWLKRALRIFPVYYLVVLLVFLFITTKGIFPLLFYYSNYAFVFDPSPHPMRHTWSLSVEEHYYAFLPFLFLLFSIEKCKRVLVGALLIILLFIIGIGLFDTSMVYGIDKFSHIRFITLLSGSLLAFYEHKIILSKTRIWSVLVLILGLFIAVPFLRFQDSIELYKLARVVSYLFFSTGLLLLIIAAVKQKLFSSFIQNILCNEKLKKIGMISYGIYLYHLPILYLFNVSHMQSTESVSLLQYLLILSLIFVVAIISYRFIEKPFLKLKEKLG